ncbi:hypothetical protein JADG_010350 [Aureobasidium aubasidani]|nr:hypothetical protein JADG_010350 [Aureobasidium pullulans]
MSPYLPQEVLALIADPLNLRAEDKLAPYTLVNKDWQFAFEARLYRSLVLNSPSDVDTGYCAKTRKTYPKPGLSWVGFDAMTSGPQPWKCRRRAAIRTISYLVAVPHLLYKVDQRGLQYYTHAKKENGRAFSRGMFHYLAVQWTDKALPISLKLALHTDMTQDAFEGRQILPSSGPVATEKSVDDYYEANLVPDIHLPTHSFRTRYPGIPLDRNHVSISAICEISSACGGSYSQKVELESERGNSVFTPAIDADHRMAVANGLGRLSPQVRELKYNYDSSEWVEDLRDDSPKITLSPDCICSALYRISMQLRHLEIQEMHISPELFWPLDSQDTTQAFRPHLEVLDLSFAAFTPAGDFLEYGYDVHEVRHCDAKFLISYLDKVYESAGRAAQHMPCIKNFTLVFYPQTYCLHFNIRNGKRVLEIATDNEYGDLQQPYRPSSRVLDAWNVSQGKMHFDGEIGRTEVEYEDWPPVGLSNSIAK